MRLIKMFDSFQDKYSILEEIELIFVDISDKFIPVDNVFKDYSENTINIRINDKSVNQYADDNYYIDIMLDSSSSKIATNNIEDLKGHILYDYLKSAIERLESIPEVKQILFYYYFNTKGIISISAYVNNYREAQEIHKFDYLLADNGFNVGKATIFYKLKNLDVTLMTQKPQLSSFDKYASLAKDITILDESNNVKATFVIDERRFNILKCKHTVDDFKLQSQWILNKYQEFKLKNVEYGTYESGGGKSSGRQGIKNLYAHDFIIWLDTQKF